MPGPIFPGGKAETPVATKPAIRPVGYVSPVRLAALAYAAIGLQTIVFVFCVWYFNDLRRYDWLSRINPLERSLFGLAEAMIDSQLPDADFSAGPGPITSQAVHERFEAFRRHAVPIFVTLATVGLFELAAFLLWQARMQRNVRALGSEGMRYGYVAGVVWWFVPLAVLWMPLKVIQELWRASDPNVSVRESRTWQLKSGSVTAIGWWSFLVLCKLLFWFAAFLLLFSLTTVFSPLALLVIAFGGMIGTGALQVEVIRSMSQRQELLNDRRLKAADKAIAAGQPVRDAQPTPGG